MHKNFYTALVLALAFITLPPSLAKAEEYTLTLKNHVFTPKELTVPADQKIKLLIKNLDNTPAEFESTDLNREKIIPPNSDGHVFVGPLSTGHYKFFDEFHQDTATGTLIVP
jgi:hypothetical protein